MSSAQTVSSKDKTLKILKQYKKNVASVSCNDFNMHIKEKNYDYNALCSWFKSDLTNYNDAILIYKLEKKKKKRRRSRRMDISHTLIKRLKHS